MNIALPQPSIADRRIQRAKELGLPTTADEAVAPLTDAQQINRTWLEACESALDRCPTEFVQQFTAIMFLGQGLITESRITAQIEAHKTALSILPR